MLKTHPRLSAERNVVGTAREQVRQAFSGFLPRVTLNGDIGPERINTPARAEPSHLSRNKVTLSVEQNLFDGLETTEGHRAANLRVEAAEERLEAVRQSLLFEAISVYYDVLRHSQLVEIALRNEATIRRQLNLEDERVEHGRGIAVDVLLAKTRLQLARENTVKLQGDMQETLARYIQAFGHPAQPETMTMPDLRIDALPVEYETAADASRENPLLRASRLDERVAERNREALRGRYYPRIGIVGQVNREDDVDALRGLRRDWSILLRVSWDLYSGFSTDAAVAAASHDYAAAKDNNAYAQLRVHQEVMAAWHRLRTSRERVRLLKNALVIATEVFEARRQRQAAGVGGETAREVLDAQREVFGAQMNLIAAKFDAEIAGFRVLLAMGELTPDNLGL